MAPCTHSFTAEPGQGTDKAITMIPPWRHCQLTARVRVHRGTHEETHQPSQTATVTQGLAII